MVRERLLNPPEDCQIDESYDLREEYLSNNTESTYEPEDENILENM